MTGTRYAGSSSATNTASTTVPMLAVTGGTTRRARVYEFNSGSEATPADNSAKFSWRRTTARGTATTSVTPNPLDAADPAAATTYDTAWSADPTITAASDLLQWAQNQRANFRWIAAPDSELVVPATAGAGLALVSAAASAAVVFDWTVLWAE